MLHLDALIVATRMQHNGKSDRWFTNGSTGSRSRTRGETSVRGLGYN